MDSEYGVVTEHVNQFKIKLQIWRKPRNERFRCSPINPYRGCHLIVVLYDPGNLESFDDVSRWMVEIERYARENVPCLLVGTKSDIDKKVISLDEAQEVAKMYHLPPVIEVSAKQNTNIDMLRRTILETVLKDKQCNTMFK